MFLQFGTQCTSNHGSALDLNANVVSPVIFFSSWQLRQTCKGWYNQAQWSREDFWAWFSERCFLVLTCLKNNFFEYPRLKKDTSRGSYLYDQWAALDIVWLECPIFWSRHPHIQRAVNQTTMSPLHDLKRLTSFQFINSERKERSCICLKDTYICDKKFTHLARHIRESLQLVMEHIFIVMSRHSSRLQQREYKRHRLWLNCWGCRYLVSQVWQRLTKLLRCCGFLARDVTPSLWGNAATKGFANTLSTMIGSLKFNSSACQLSFLRLTSLPHSSQFWKASSLKWAACLDNGL